MCLRAAFLLATEPFPMHFPLLFNFISDFVLYCGQFYANFYVSMEEKLDAPQLR